MAPDPAADVGKEGGHDAIPASVIAQAEAAIVGNFEDDSPSLSKSSSRTLSRESTRTSKQDYSQHQKTHRPSAAGGDLPSADRNRDLLSVDDTHEPPPAYGAEPNRIELSQDGFSTTANVTDDGRINIDINQKTRKLSDFLVPALRNQLSLVAQEEEDQPLPTGYIPPALGGQPGQIPPPKLNVVVHVVGSRGDVQPFVALGKTLKATYGHRVRIATHPTFKGFVEENGLEFFSIGGDPSELMAFMVKNPGLMPGFDSLKSGDVGKRRKGMEEIVLGCWRSCIEAGDGLGPRNTSDAIGFDAGINMDSNPGDQPFIADAIIANPPSFAHVHIAEKLGIPLHMMFTMPWSPTQQFPHPLANIQSSNADVNMTNFVSYALVEMMTWQGLGDVINRFRERALGLDPISLIWAPGMQSRLRVPYTYCWSPALIPKPKDWGKHISISGFYFLSLASSFTPEPELAEYLAAGPPPVYIGFGSIVVDDPDAMTKMIFEAIKIAGVRALVSKGWGGLGGDALGIPEGVFMLGNVPHDWLFNHVSCVVHHGGAGTTAAGIATGKPTVVVPFFGDQPFWGAMVARAGAGPAPIAYKQLTAEKLAAAILTALKPETLERAKELGLRIKEENGTDVGAKSFHDLLEVDKLRCTIVPSKAAVWRVKRTQTRLSAFAANILASEGLLSFADLKLYRPREYETEDGPWDPVSGGASALLGTIGSMTMGIADIPVEIFKSAKNKHIRKESAPSNSSTSNSGDSTPQQSSRAQSDLGQNETPEPSSYFPKAETPPSATTRSSYEGTQSSTDNVAVSTPLTSVSSLGEARSSMREALRGSLTRSRSQSRERHCSRSHSRSQSRDREFDPSKLTLENAVGAGKGISRIVGAGLKSPMDFTLGIARGFHNAPKLYGDDTIRPQQTVTDFKSGLRAATKEFGFGLYDGITGLVTQPLKGAEKEGAAGFIKGVGKGIGGAFLKPGAAFWGIPGYAFLGIHKEIRKVFGASVLNYMISARTAQGFEDAKAATPEERQHVLNEWIQHKTEYQNSKMKIQEQGGPEGQESGRLTPKGFMQTRHMTFDERKKLHDDRKKVREEQRNKIHGGGHYCPFCLRTAPHTHNPRAVQTSPSVVPASSGNSTEDFEQAIKSSVAATSRGDPEQDLMIERAIRASVRALEGSDSSALNDQDAVNKAIQASIAASAQGGPAGAGTAALSNEEAEHQAALEQAIQKSLTEYQFKTGDAAVDEDSDADENMKLAIKMSKEQQVDPDSEDDMFKLAIQESKDESEKPKTEEEIVLEYVKKQSLLEEEHRKASAEKQKGPEVETLSPEHSAADEEALNKAIEESLKLQGGEASGSGS